MIKKTAALFLAACLTAACFTASASAYLMGDLNWDGILSPEDARLALRAAVKLDVIEKNWANFDVADVDRNGEIEPSDARHILRASVKLENLEDLIRGDLDWIFQHNAEWWKDYRNKALCDAYYEQVERLIFQSGKGRVTKSWGVSDSLDGVSVVRLVDLDRDGTPELYCAFSESKVSDYSDMQAVYRFHNGKLETLYEGGMTNGGSDYSPLVAFDDIDGTIYFVGGMTFDRWYTSFDNGTVNTTEFFESDCLINGKKATQEQYEAAYQKFKANPDRISAVIYISLGDDDAEYYNAVLNETESVIALLKKGAEG